MLEYVPDQYKTQEMCNETVEKSPRMLKYVPDLFVTQEMCNEAVQSDPWMLKYVPDSFVTQEMCNEAVKKRPDVVLRWYKGYEQRKPQKLKIKEELMPVAWHPD